MKSNLVIVTIETKSKMGQAAIESLLDDYEHAEAIMTRLEDTLREYIAQTGVMGTKPYAVFAGEHGLQKRARAISTRGLPCAPS